VCGSYATLTVRKEQGVPKRSDTSYHKRMLASRMENPEFRAEYARARREIDQVDSVVRQLDELREAAGLSKAELARRIGRDPSSIRRLFTAQANPELLLVASIAEDLGAEVRIVPRSTGRRRKTAA
jgi:ribosome-binding protein aMBF1 (putative translation factor)